MCFIWTACGPVDTQRPSEMECREISGHPRGPPHVRTTGREAAKRPVLVPRRVGTDGLGGNTTRRRCRRVWAFEPICEPSRALRLWVPGPVSSPLRWHRQDDRIGRSGINARPERTVAGSPNCEMTGWLADYSSVSLPKSCYRGPEGAGCRPERPEQGPLLSRGWQLLAVSRSQLAGFAG